MKNKAIIVCNLITKSNIQKTQYNIVFLQDKLDKNPITNTNMQKNTNTQLHLSFSTLTQAQNYLKNNNISYTIETNQKAVTQPKSYTQNFKKIN